MRSRWSQAARWLTLPGRMPEYRAEKSLLAADGRNQTLGYESSLRVGMNLMVAVFEGESELVNNFRPELPENIKTHVTGNADAYSSGYRPYTAGVPGVISVTQSRRSGCAQPFREIKHFPAGITLRHKNMGKRMPKASARSSFQSSVVAWILAKHNRKQVSMKKAARHRVRERRAVSLCVTGRALAEAGIVIARLREASVQRGSHEVGRLDTVLHEEVEFLRRIQGAYG